LPADQAQSEVGEQVKPRVVILVTLAEVGGAQTYVALLTEALRDRFDVVVAAYGPGPLVDAVRNAGARFVPLRNVRRALHPLRDVLGLFELIRLLRRERPVIVHANSSKAGILGRVAAALTHVPVRIFTVHGWAFNAYTGFARQMYLWSERLVAPLTTLTICVADRERATGLAARACNADRTVVLHNAVPTAPAREGQPARTPVVLAVGRLKAPKDFSTLLHALGRLLPGTYRALIAGDGPEREQLETEARQLGLASSVEFLGERNDIPDLIRSSDLFVLSTRSEGLPMSVLEAMAAGLPVVASEVGGIPELVDAETGVLVPPEDPAALSTAVERLLADQGLRARLGAAGRARAEERFDLESWGRAHIRLYERELERAGVIPVDTPS
jgi:glycosyltransferase involved in cell wall biosynthesis